MMKRRRMEFKTDYHKRMALLKFGKPRIVFRKSSRYVLGQYIESKSAQDRIVVQAQSRELLKLGWPQKYAGSLKSLPACFLTGLLMGKRIKEKYGDQEVILDLGLLRNLSGSRIYAFVKGVTQSQIKVRCEESYFPIEERIIGRHMKKEIYEIINTITKNIEKE